LDANGGELKNCWQFLEIHYCWLYLASLAKYSLSTAKLTVSAALKTLLSALGGNLISRIEELNNSLGLTQIFVN
jgi:hypothetical protein